LTALSNLSRSLNALITIAVGVVILVAGVTYTGVAPVTYRSHATLVLVPKPQKPSDVGGILDSFDRSATAGTYVELLASDDTRKAAGNPPVTIKVRSIPDTRAITVSASAQDKNIVQPALRAIVAAAQREQVKLVDVYDLQTLQSPSAPSRASTSPSLIIIATVLLSLLGALATWTLLRRLRTPPDRRRRPPRPEEFTADWLREGQRYPTSR
jgi:capsular polysaccharide biosynthesis protein